LDVLTVTAAAATFLWYFTVSKEFTGDVDGVMVLSSLITPLLMIVCVFAMTRIVIGGERVLDRKAFTMFATANALITPVTALQPVFEKELAGLTGIIAGPLLFLFVVSAHWQKNALLSPDAEKERARRPYSLLPYLAIGATLFLLLLSGGGSLQDQGVVIGSVCITLLVVVRQLAAFHENANLLRQVDVNLEELQAAYQREIAAQVQREELESELRHAQKLEAVGRLAAGIAHEINTPLQFISDNLRFIEEGVKWTTDVFAESREHYLAAGTVDIEDLDYYSEDLPRAVADGLEGAHRVSRIVHAMKAFSHVGRAELGAADINEAIRNTVIVAGSELRDIASVRTELGEIPLVQCRLGEINQVFLNLIVNAAHAVSEIRTIDTGLIVIRTSLVGDYVKIEVEDNGCGIPEDAQGHIFEPFFTTKEVGRGTGQGLSLARSEIKRHGGDIQFVTNPGRGTTFIITLPLIASEAAADGSRSAVTRFAYKDEETHLIGKH
jgi:signal transduction histidine kinase